MLRLPHRIYVICSSCCSIVLALRSALPSTKSTCTPQLSTCHNMLLPIWKSMLPKGDGTNNQYCNIWGHRLLQSGTNTHASVVWWIVLWYWGRAVFIINSELLRSHVSHCRLLLVFVKKTNKYCHFRYIYCPLLCQLRYRDVSKGETISRLIH